MYSWVRCEGGRTRLMLAPPTLVGKFPFSFEPKRNTFLSHHLKSEGTGVLLTSLRTLCSCPSPVCVFANGRGMSTIERALASLRHWMNSLERRCKHACEKFYNRVSRLPVKQCVHGRRRCVYPSVVSGLPMVLGTLQRIHSYTLFVLACILLFPYTSICIHASPFLYSIDRVPLVFGS